MDKFYIDGLLVVEGKLDQAKISSFLLSPIITTNGFDTNNRLINFLNKVSQKHKVYLFMDNDASGHKIADKLLKNVANTINLCLDCDEFESKKKKGNAEIKVKILYDFLLPLKADGNGFQSDISATFLVSIFLNNSMFKSYVVDRYSLINGNNKFITTQLVLLDVTKRDILSLLEEYGNK